MSLLAARYSGLLPGNAMRANLQHYWVASHSARGARNGSRTTDLCKLTLGIEGQLRLSFGVDRRALEEAQIDFRTVIPTLLGGVYGVSAVCLDSRLTTEAARAP
jgi:hypothetical protein